MACMIMVDPRAAATARLQSDDYIEMSLPSASPSPSQSPNNLEFEATATVPPTFQKNSKPPTVKNKHKLLPPCRMVTTRGHRSSHPTPTAMPTQSALLPAAPTSSGGPVLHTRTPVCLLTYTRAHVRVRPAPCQSRRLLRRRQTPRRLQVPCHCRQQHARTA